MAGQHIEREARAAATGLTPVQRDKYIVQWKNAGHSFSQIGKRLGMSKSAVKYRYDAAALGKSRQARQVDMCQGCWEGFYRDQLNEAGLCPKCAAGAPEKPPPPESW
jgi:hypothetical protein